jgi:hypothetical protein
MIFHQIDTREHYNDLLQVKEGQEKGWPQQAETRVEGGDSGKRIGRGKRGEDVGARRKGQREGVQVRGW